jgi:hypothetical protein
VSGVVNEVPTLSNAVPADRDPVLLNRRWYAHNLSAGRYTVPGDGNAMPG